MRIGCKDKPSRRPRSAWRKLAVAATTVMLCAAFAAVGHAVYAQEAEWEHEVGPAVTAKVVDTELSRVPRTTRQSTPLDLEPLALALIPDGWPQPPGEMGTGDGLQFTFRSPLIDAVTAPEFLNPNPNFDGIAQNGASPPDTTGDIGPNHYVQAVNGGGAADTQLQIFDRQGNTLAGPLSTNTTLWTGLPRCGANALTDPIVLYDEVADRWVFGEFARNPNAICVAVSQGANPATSGWYVYEFQVSFTPDYPKFGVWPDGYYLTTQRGFPGAGLDVWVMDRANMLNGNPTTTQRFYRNETSLFLLPADFDGPPPPAGTPEYFARHVDGDQWGGNDRVEVFEFAVDWVDPTNTTFSGPTTINSVAFDANLCLAGDLGDSCVPQPGTAQLLDTTPHWPMWRLQYRNFDTHQSLVLNHTVDADGSGHAGIRWHELQDTGGGFVMHQEGTYSPDTGNAGLGDDPHRWLGSVAMDKAGNMALGFSVSSSTVFPGIQYAGRLATDPAGLMPHGPVTVINGAGSQGGNRWGDYSHLSVDPVDGCTFWFTTEYIPASGAWRTRVAAFRFPSCNPADLSITKTARTDPTTAGAQLFYDIQVRNHGSDDATNVTVTDTLPPEVTYVTDTAGCDTSALPTLTCNLGDLAAGDTVDFSIKVIVDADVVANAGGPTPITNVASVDSDQEDPDESNNEDSVTIVVEELADLMVAKLCKPDGPLAAGNEAECTVFIDNLGPSDARSVELVDALVSEGNFTLGTPDPSQGSCVVGIVNDVDTITCDLGNLDAGSRATVIYTVTAQEAMDINNIATATSDTPDPDASNNTAEDSISVFGVADLGLTKSDAPDPVTAGLNLTYTLQVSNNGPSTATNVVIEDIGPSGVTINSVTSTGGGSCNAGVPGDSTQPSRCTFGSMNMGDVETMTISVTVMPQTLGILHNDAEVSSNTFDDNNANDLATADTTVATEADLVVVKSDSPDPVLAGDLITYTIDVSNNGPSTARDVMLVDMLPGEVTFDMATATNGAPCTLAQPDRVECELGDLDPGESVTVYIDVLVDPSVPHGTTITNLVDVNSTTPDPNGASDSEDTLVNTAADLWIDKTGNFQTGNPSGTVRYFLTVYNQPGCSEDDPLVCGMGGPSDAVNVVVIDHLPLDRKKFRVEFVSESCTYDSATHTVECTEPVIPYGTFVQFEIQADVKGKADLSNFASASSDTADPVANNNMDTHFISIKGGKGDPGGP